MKASEHQRNQVRSKEKRRKGAHLFAATRDHHRGEIAEDYTEIIAQLIEQEGEARVMSLSACLGVSHVTVLRTLRRLEDEGLVITQVRGPILLSEKGQVLAKFSHDRHRAVVALLKMLGVPDAIAEVDAEGAEHHFSEVSIDAIQRFLSAQSSK
jgi:DtxR family transcriptional regulator, manganese transport regulator